MPAGQAMQVNKDSQVCADLLSRICVLLLIATPIYHIQHVPPTNIMGMCINSALICLFSHCHRLVSPLHF